MVVRIKGLEKFVTVIGSYYSLIKYHFDLEISSLVSLLYITKFQKNTSLCDNGLPRLTILTQMARIIAGIFAACFLSATIFRASRERLEKILKQNIF